MYSPFRHVPSIFVKGKPIHLTLFVTRRCNASCRFCFYLESDDRRPTDGEELSLSEIQQVSNSMGSLMWVAFSGGEIFLRDDLPEISQQFHDVNRAAIMLYPTNGLMPELIEKRVRRILKDCPNSAIAVKLSLDGLAEVHDRLRGVPGAFDTVLETQRRLAPLLGRYPNFELGINTVFLPQNQDSIDALIDFVQTIPGITTHSLSLVRGQLKEPEFKTVDLSKYRAAADRLARETRKGLQPTYRFSGAKLKAAQDVLQREMIYRTATEDRRVTPCYAGRINIVLAENGDVYPCEILDRPMGNVRNVNYDVNAILATDQARRILGPIADAQCHCTHECNFITNILFNPRLMPALFREYLRISADR